MIPASRNIFQIQPIYSNEVVTGIKKYCLDFCLPLTEGFRRLREEDITVLEYVQQHVMPIS